MCELSFILEMELRREGMIKEVRREFDIIKLCCKLLADPSVDRNIIDRILVMPLRKLLCEDKSVLLKLVPNLKLSPLSGDFIEVDGGLHITTPKLLALSEDKWLSIEDWRNQIIAYFDKNENDLPEKYPEFTFLQIKNKLKNADKIIFESMFDTEEVDYGYGKEIYYRRKNRGNTNENTVIFQLLKDIGYYDLTTFKFIKHISDKRGAHIDVGYAPLIKIINDPQKNGFSLILSIAIQTIYAVRKQIPELIDYWPDMAIEEEE